MFSISICFYYRVTHHFGGSIYVCPFLTDFPLRNPDFSPKKDCLRRPWCDKSFRSSGTKKRTRALRTEGAEKKHEVSNEKRKVVISGIWGITGGDEILNHYKITIEILGDNYSR